MSRRRSRPLYTETQVIITAIAIALCCLVPILCLVPPTGIRAAAHAQEDNSPMTTVATWQQTEFKTPNRQFFRDKGDYYSLDQFIPSRDLRQLERFPTWGTRLAFPEHWDWTEGAHYDEDDNRFVFIGRSDTSGTNALSTYYVAHSDWSVSARTQLTTTIDDIGGIHNRNVLFKFDTYMIVGDDGNVYQATDYSSALSAVYSDGDAQALLAVRDTIWLLTTADEILRWDPDTPAFAAYFTPEMPLNARYWLHFRDYFMLFGQQTDGTMIIYQVDDHEPVDIRQLATLPNESGHYLGGAFALDWASPFTIHEDRVYFSPGAYRTYNDSSPNFDKVPIYVFDGNSVELVDIVQSEIVPQVWGLLSWKGRLLLYFFRDQDEYIYLYTGGRFVQILYTEVDLLTRADLYCLAGDLATNTESQAGTGDGVQFLRAAAATNTFTSSWLDMGRPTSVKFLSRLSAVVSGQAEDLEVKVEYRTELNGTTGSWTTAVANTDNQRHLVAEDLGVRFHLLQIRVTFTDNTSTDPDTRLETIAATYSYGVK
jgi:hypothetical protein